MVSTPTTTTHPSSELMSSTCPQPRDLTSTILTRGSTPSLKEATQGEQVRTHGRVVPWDRLQPTATWKPRLPAHGAGRPLRHLRQPLPAFPATSLQGRSSHSLYGQLPAVLPFSGGGFRATMAHFRFPSAEVARPEHTFLSVDKVYLVQERWMRGAEKTLAPWRPGGRCRRGREGGTELPRRREL